MPPSLDARGLVCRLVRRSSSGGGSLSGGGRAGGASLPLALELSHVGDDRPSVRWGDRPAVRRHESHPIRDDVKELPVRVLQDLLVVEAGGGDAASLEQDPFAVPASIVARLAIDSIPLAAPLDKRLVHGYGDRRDELIVRSLPCEEGSIFPESTDRNRSRNGIAHGRTVVEELAGGLGEDLRLIVHARVEMDGRTTRRAAARATSHRDSGRKSERTEHPSAAADASAEKPCGGAHALPLSSRSGFGLRTLAR